MNSIVKYKYALCSHNKGKASEIQFLWTCPYFGARSMKKLVYFTIFSQTQGIFYRCLQTVEVNVDLVLPNEPLIIRKFNLELVHPLNALLQTNLVSGQTNPNKHQMRPSEGRCNYYSDKLRTSPGQKVQCVKLIFKDQFS